MAKQATQRTETNPGELDINALGIASRLKFVRERAGLAQRELGKRAGVTNVTISLIEQGNHAPSLSSLYRILNAIPISMAEFFALPMSSQGIMVYRKEDLTVVTHGDADIRALGGEHPNKKLQVFSERYEPGASTGGEWISHAGETAAVLVQGTVELEVDGQTHRIQAGGAFQIFERHPYRLTNVGRSTAILVCACTPPMF
jgi:transcriptional regulator with XRE-family HTH domain